MGLNLCIDPSIVTSLHFCCRRQEQKLMHSRTNLLGESWGHVNTRANVQIEIVSHIYTASSPEQSKTIVEASVANQD